MAEPVTTEELESDLTAMEARIDRDAKAGLVSPEAERGIRAIIAAVREALANRKAGEWRPIAEAPKDGTRVLLADAKNVVAGCWGVTRRAGVVTGVDWQCDWRVGKPGDKPTHWRFLPAPPLPLTDAGG